MEPTTRPAVVKVGRNGEPYWDGVLVNATELGSKLAELRADGRGVVYYRESPEREPTAAQLETFEVILGARVPIMLTSRADTVRARMASCAVAVCLAHARRQAPAVATTVE